VPERLNGTVSTIAVPQNGPVAESTLFQLNSHTGQQLAPGYALDLGASVSAFQRCSRDEL